jgi:hypothetical protein
MPVPNASSARQAATLTSLIVSSSQSFRQQPTRYRSVAGAQYCRISMLFCDGSVSLENFFGIKKFDRNGALDNKNVHNARRLAAKKLSIFPS